MPALNRNNSNWSFEERRKINENWDILETATNSAALGNNQIKEEVEELRESVSLNSAKTYESLQKANQANASANNSLAVANQANTNANNVLNVAQEANEKSESAINESNNAKDVAESVRNQFDQVIAEAGSNNPEVVASRTDPQSGETFVNLPERLNTQHSQLTSRLDNIVVSVKDFGAIGDGVTDDTNAIRLAISHALTVGRTLYFPNGKYYVTDTIDVTGVKIQGEEQGFARLIPYTSKRLGYLGYDFFINFGNGASVTYDEMLDEAVTGTVITSDVANPILKYVTNGRNRGFDLQDIGFVGWNRNKEQVGLGYEVDGTVTYIPGGHYFKNVSVMGMGSHGVHIASLEVSDLDNLHVTQNNGNGFRIEQVPGIDCPFEYVNVNVGAISHNRLDGFWFNNFRKNVFFNKTILQNPGQYDLRRTNSPDGYDRTPPENSKDLIAGIRMEGVTDIDSFNRQGRTIVFDGVYGELAEKLIHIKNKLGSATLRDVVIKNSAQVRRNSNFSTLFYLEANYVYNMEVDHNNVNNNVFGVVDISATNGANNFKGQLEFFNISPDSVKRAFVLKNAEVETDKLTVVNSGYWSLQNNSSVEQVVSTMIPRNILGTYYPSINTPYRYMKFSISYNHQATNGTGIVLDEFYYTRDNTGKFQISRITNNIPSLACDPTTGVISFTCPAFKSVTLQRIDNLFFKNI